MAISSLVVRTGIGAWGDIAHLITRGLDLGAVADIWTDNASPTTSWSSGAAPSNTWTDNAAPATTWTTNT